MSPDAKGRIYEALKRTLEQQLAREGFRLGAQGCEPAIQSPWSMLVDERNAWRVPMRLNHQLYAEIRGQFDDNLVKEILFAAAGIKISRTLLSDEKLELLQRIADRHTFRVLASSEQYIHRCDVGKGGFANVIERVAGTDQANARRIVYIAADRSLVETGRLLEETGDDELFGLLLGIPACCREAYVRFRPIAQARQNDCIPLALDNTSGEMPYDPHLNFAAIYFGANLLSFFPCSFRCPVAGVVARSTFEMLAECDKAWAHSFLDLQRTNIIYTEYQGLHLFRQPFIDGSIHYGPYDFDSTQQTNVATLFGRGDRLKVRGKHALDIYCGAKRIGVLEGEDISMCVFW
jgi:hypothetical protein